VCVHCTCTHGGVKGSIDDRCTHSFPFPSLPFPINQNQKHVTPHDHQDAVTTEAMAFIVRHCSGVVCVSMEGEELDRLKLPPMIVNNEVRAMQAGRACLKCNGL
jgi:hypothetical protein